MAPVGEDGQGSRKRRRQERDIRSIGCLHGLAQRSRHVESLGQQAAAHSWVSGHQPRDASELPQQCLGPLGSGRRREWATDLLLQQGRLLKAGSHVTALFPGRSPSCCRRQRGHAKRRPPAPSRSRGTPERLFRVKERQINGSEVTSADVHQLGFETTTRPTEATLDGSYPRTGVGNDLLLRRRSWNIGEAGAVV
jgi:hypothetical protein